MNLEKLAMKIVENGMNGKYNKRDSWPPKISDIGPQLLYTDILKALKKSYLKGKLENQS